MLKKEKIEKLSIEDKITYAKSQLWNIKQKEEKEGIELLIAIIKELKEKEEWFKRLCNKNAKTIERKNLTIDLMAKTRNKVKNKVIFKTKEQAQRYADYQKAKEEYSYEFSREEWEDRTIVKYYFWLDMYDKKIVISHIVGGIYANMIYFKTKEQAQEFIDKYKTEILEFEFFVK